MKRRKRKKERRGRKEKQKGRDGKRKGAREGGRLKLNLDKSYAGPCVSQL